MLSDRQEPYADYLRAAFESDAPEARKLVQDIVRHSTHLRGTQPYWNARCHNLRAYIQNLGAAHLFVTH
ncbi:hypothetical protein N7535_003015 [Penicillium sp. DV-2018c]|nr:hypothetical protein N7461_001297 [Penicillium sp. DV-2018c]KAJ5576089.1 hypothetical protein N7535_003015 [Penicillium sp. DV-2018c]